MTFFRPLRWCRAVVHTGSPSMQRAGGKVVVDHAGGLHVGIADGGTDKGEAAFFKCRTHGIGFFRFGGKLFRGLPFVLNRFVICELPDELIETAEFLLDFQKGLGVSDRAPNLQAVSDNPGVA